MAVGGSVVLSVVFLIGMQLQSSTRSEAAILTVVNNCPFTIWPAIQPNNGYPNLERGGFGLQNLAHHSFPAPKAPWSGRLWARTDCSPSSGGRRLSCATGDYANSSATLAQVVLHGDDSYYYYSYGVSLVDGFNLPMTVTPHEGNGPCPVVGCQADLLASCPAPLQVRVSNAVVGCRSGCSAFGTDELCCRNRYSAAGMCRPSNYSEGFKQACPQTFTYPQDTASIMHECAAPRELKLIFCPS